MPEFILPKRSAKEWAKDLLFIFLGNLSLAVSSVFFILPNNLLTGGLAGIAVILNKLFGFNETVVIYVLSLGLFTVGALLLGKTFALTTVCSAILYPLLVSILNMIYVPLDVDYLVASIYAGALLGAGSGLVFRTGGSTGGMDIPPLLMRKFFGLDLGLGTVLTDGLTVLAGIIAYGLSPALIGLISVYVCGMVIDKVLVLGGETSKVAMINSLEWKKISQTLQDELDRGVTILEGIGGYSKKRRPVVYCAISQRQYGELMRIVRAIDPTAFVVVSDATEVHGEGFTYSDPDGPSDMEKGEG